MDDLAHILTDPLGTREESNGQITEECMLGNCRVSLPEDLLEDPDVFFSVMSESTWTDVLSDSQRHHLRQFLPQFPGNNVAVQDSAVSNLFNNQSFNFGNPLHLAQRLFRDGYFNPEVVKYRQLCAKSQRKRRLYSLQQYYHRLLKQILVSRKDLLELAVHSGLDVPQKRPLNPRGQLEPQEPRIRRRVGRILREVKAECGDSNASSDDDGESWPPAPQSPSSPTTSLPLRVLPSLSTQDMKTAEKPELGVQDLKSMLQNHREKRKRHPDHPDLVTSDIHLGNMLSRVNIGRKGSSVALFDLALPKKKIKEERRKKRLRTTVKLEAEDPCEALMTSDAAALSANHVPSLPDTPTPPPLANVKEEVIEECQSSPAVVEEISISFFNLLESIMKTENLSSTSLLEEKVQTWQLSPATSLNPWFSFASCWSELVLPALQFLAGEAKDGMMTLPTGFSPYVEFGDQSQQWRWIGPSLDAEKDLSALCQLWIDSKDLVVKGMSSDVRLVFPCPSSWTDYVVRPSTGDERHVFQIQEQQRYDQPHKAFTFRMHGFESVVGPVKGVFDKEMSLNKAREHTLLRSDRPAYVTILSLVRDAAARLPNGEGTRAEICELLKDSQFLAPDVTSAQVNTVVSGALDRLHYEKDPCVKYDIGRKLWIYLHRDRSQEEFERIHQAQAAAAKARKALQQKPKPAPKPVKSATASSKSCATVMLQLCFRYAQVAGGSTPPPPLTRCRCVPPPPSRVLLVAPPSMPQLGSLLPSSQAASAAAQQPPSSSSLSASHQHAARLVSHLGTGALPQVRMVSAQPAVGGPQAALLHQTAHQIRVPVTRVLQTVVSLPLRSQAGSSPMGVPTTLSVSALAVAKPRPGSPGSPAKTLVTPALLQGMAGQSIKQVSITGQLGVKTSVGGGGIPITATNLRIQGKDVLRLPPSSITTDSKGQTVLRITPDMMATLAKSPVATVKLSPDFLGSAGHGGGKSISATLHVTPPHSSSSSSSSTLSSLVTEAGKAGAADTAIRLMPTLAVTVGDQKTRTFSTHVSSASGDSKGAATIRIMPGLGVIPHKQGQTITMTTMAGSKPLTVSAGPGTVTMAAAGALGAKGITVSASPLTIGTATGTVRHVPVTATVVTTQAGKLPTRITVPLSVLNQPLKTKSVVTSPMVKGSLNTSLSSLGRNIILTTMPAGTKLMAGNKPVSFVTAQQLQQLQQQGQATQVRIQTVQTQQIQQHVATGSPKSVSTVVVTTAPSLKCPPDPSAAPQP
uniref:Nuclear factor related to kappa-B-binding protein n=1 Tax=Gadus morhua TaxID=8049 RepID=A0A8C5CQD2_GADMO